MIKRKILWQLCFVAFSQLCNASENTIFLPDGGLEVRVPSNWGIVGHKPSGNQTVAAFQLFENKAEVGTEESTNLSVTIFNLKDPETMLEFIQPLTQGVKDGELDSKFGEWVIRDWSGKQGDVQYRISDARLSHSRLGSGIHVRLAWPMLKGNPKDYDEQMKKLLHNFLGEVTKRNPIEVEQPSADRPPTSSESKPESMKKPQPESKPTPR